MELDGQYLVKLSPAASPPPTLQTSLAFDAAAGLLVLFGGTKYVAGNAAPSADTWTGTGTAWTQLHPASSPSARVGAALAYDPATSQLLLFGGACGIELGDTWNWTGGTWSKLNPPTTPTARSFPALAYDTATIQFLLQGGATAAGAVSEQWAWTGSSWLKQSPLSMPTPARHGRAIAL